MTLRQPDCTCSYYGAKRGEVILYPGMPDPECPVHGRRFTEGCCPHCGYGVPASGFCPCNRKDAETDGN